jgi:hypothetical protein
MRLPSRVLNQDESFLAKERLGQNALQSPTSNKGEND